jgi:hypothetical protein
MGYIPVYSKVIERVRLLEAPFGPPPKLSERFVMIHYVNPEIFPYCRLLPGYYPLFSSETADTHDIVLFLVNY